MENVKQLVRTELTNLDNWTPMSEGYSGSNYNHHWAEDWDISDEFKKDLFVRGYKGEAYHEWDGERLMIEHASTSRHRESIYFDVTEIESLDEIDSEIIDEVIEQMFQGKEIDFLEAVNA
tara:strand:- start:401 stop:760 length:360 start_codon:yes stop_codon:yes gene_type:complete